MMRTDHWDQLMAASQAGNGTAYERLLHELQRWLARYYRHRLPGSMVDDAIQDALIAVHEKRRTYDPSRPFKPWLMAIARYKWIDRLRVMERQKYVQLPGNLGAQSHESKVASATVLEQLLADLKPAQAEAIRLVKLQGYSIEETSRRTGQSTALVKVNIHRGLAKMAAIVRG